ncbi:MAG TPA: ABC transporter substrate-binding protein [Xanthobacteraceae bacterium]|jgi:branched-chain amino acid transport system substrate-binding protein
MRKFLATAGIAGAFALAAMGAQAQSVKVGVMLTLSGPAAVLGQHARDGFQLGIKHLGGKLGGLTADIIVVDDELKPDVGVQKVQALLERDKVDIVVGVIFSNVMMAIAKPVFDANTILVSPNAGPSPLAGRGCSPWFFSTAWQNDQNHEAMGKYAQDAGYKKVVLIAPNYQAGKDSMAGFKRHFKGEIVEEIFNQVNQLDFAAEIAKIASLKPDAVFAFEPGGMGVNFVKQYAQAGLAGKIPFLSAFTVDETTLPATQDAAVGLFAGSQWAPNLENPVSKKFVADYEKDYGKVPAMYAAQGYDAALLIDAAIKAAGGKVADKAALRDAFKRASFASIRGAPFKLNTNGFPIQDVYVVKAVKRADGKFATETVAKVFTGYTDAYAKDCPLK